MKILLTLLIVFSVIGGVPINGAWSFLYQLEFVEMPSIIRSGHQTTGEMIAWVLMLISHGAIFILPFITKKYYFRSTLVIAPLLFILTFVAFANIFAFLFLLPFVIVWIIALIIGRNREANWARM